MHIQTNKAKVSTKVSIFFWSLSLLRGTPVTFLGFFKMPWLERGNPNMLLWQAIPPSSNTDQTRPDWTWTYSLGTERFFRFSFLRATKWSNLFHEMKINSTAFYSIVFLVNIALSHRALHGNNMIISGFYLFCIMVRIRPVSNTAEISYIWLF